MMIQTKANPLNIFHILVAEARENSVIEWSGNLTLVPQENGEIFIDISFIEQPVFRDSLDQASSLGNPGLSIDFIGKANAYT
jgi:hypothetical protein